MAARGALAAAQQDGCAAYSLALFRAYVQAGSSITETTTLADAACEAQLDSERFADALGNPTLDEQLHANCDELLERGGFGTPTMFLADDMYFGHDRMPLVEFAIGQSSDRRFVVPGDHRA